MDKNIDFSNQMELEHILGDIDLNEDAPVEEKVYGNCCVNFFGKRYLLPEIRHI